MSKPRWMDHPEGWEDQWGDLLDVAEEADMTCRDRGKQKARARMIIRQDARIKELEKQKLQLTGDPKGGPSGLVGRAFHFAVVGQLEEKVATLERQLLSVMANMKDRGDEQ